MLAIPVGVDDHQLGDAGAPITLVEYGDYQCPYCAYAAPVVDQVRQELGAQLRFVFRNLPLREIHPRAQRAAQAAEAVSLQGMFWPMHDLLFEHHDDLEDQALLHYAATAGADIQLFKDAIDSAPVIERIDADLHGALASGADGTPTFYVNGARYDGSWELEPLLERLSSEAVRRH